jgi:ABC-type glycerol-3-phosphate transport system substrate-binding protein
MKTERESDLFSHQTGPARESFRSLSNTLSLACALIFLTIGLAACDLTLVPPQTTPPTEEPTVTPEPEPTETPEPGVTSLVFWEPFPLDRPQGLLLGEMIRDFEAENPDIRIEIVPKSGYVGIHGAMQAELPDGELPDLAVAFPSMIAEYAAAGVVAPLDPYINDPEIGLTETDTVDIFPGFLEAGRLPGQGRQMLAFPL